MYGNTTSVRIAAESLIMRYRSDTSPPPDRVGLEIGLSLVVGQESHCPLLCGRVGSRRRGVTQGMSWAEDVLQPW